VKAAGDPDAVARLVGWQERVGGTITVRTALFVTRPQELEATREKRA
jgi:hypothetical protein